jgi:hypothetical protein
MYRSSSLAAMKFIGKREEKSVRWSKALVLGGKALLGMMVIGTLALSTPPAHAQCLHRHYGHAGHWGRYGHAGHWGWYGHAGYYGQYVPYANPSWFVYWNSPMNLAEQQWADMEASELARLIRGLRQDESGTRKQLASLLRQRELLSKFCNGVSSTSTQSALRKSLATLTQTTTIEHILQADVPSLPTEEFIAHDWLPGIIQADGSLVEAPPVLDMGPEGGDVSVCQARLEQGWGEVRKSLRRGQRIPARDVDEFQQSVKRYTVAAQPVLRRASEMARFHGQKYLNLLKDLAEKLNAVRAMPAADMTRVVDFFGLFKWPAVSYLGFSNNHSNYLKPCSNTKLRSATWINFWSV